MRSSLIYRQWSNTVESVVPDDEIVSVLPQDDVSVAYNTLFGSVVLPSQVDVLLDNDEVISVDVTWDEGDYDPDEDHLSNNTYTLTGTLANLPEGVLNTAGEVAFIDVIVLAYDDSGLANSKALYQAIGTGQSSQTTVSVAWPTHLTDDVGVLVVEIDEDDPVPATPDGWILKGNSAGALSGSTDTELVIFYRRATSNAEPNVVLDITGGDHAHAVIFTVRGAFKVGDPFDVVDFTQSKATASTNVSIAGVTANQDGCDVFYICSRGTDSNGPSYNGTPTNASLTGVAERYDVGTTLGGGGGLGIFSGNLATAGATGTFTNTLNVTSSESYAVLTFKGVNNFSEPSGQIANLTLEGDRQVNIGNQGSGSRFIALYNTSGTISATDLPVDGEDYTVGQDIGNGNIVAFNGLNQNKFYLPFLTPASTPAVVAYSYNVSGSGNLYNTDSATNNPITPTLPAAALHFLNHSPIAQPVRNIAHPEDSGILAPVSKTFPWGFAETSTEYLLFVPGDNNASSTGIPDHLDMTYLRIKQKDDGLPITEGWEYHEVDGDGLPVPILAGFVPSAVSGTRYQGWISGTYVVSDTEIRVMYQENVGAIGARYSVGTGLLTKTGDVWSLAFDSSYILTQTTDKSYQVARFYFSDTLSKWVLIAQNVKAVRTEVYTSATWNSGYTLRITDLIQNPEFAPGNSVAGSPQNFSMFSDLWEDETYTYFFGSLKHCPLYRGGNGVTPIYGGLHTQIGLCKIATADLDTSSADIIIEGVRYEADTRDALAVYPVSKPFTFDLVSHQIIGRFRWRIEDQVGNFDQVTVDACVLSESAVEPTGYAAVGQDVYEENIRWYRIHNPSVSDVLGDPCVPYNVITGDPLTINGIAPEQYSQTKGTMDGSSSIEDEDAPPHLDPTWDAENFAIVAFINAGTTGVRRSIYKVDGLIDFYIDTDNRPGVDVTGLGGGQKRLKVTGSGYAGTVFFPAHTAYYVRVNRNGANMDVVLGTGYTTAIPDINTLQNDTFTEVAASMNNNIMYDDFDSTVGDVIVLWGANATAEAILKQI